MKYISEKKEILNYYKEIKELIIRNDKDFPVSIIERVDLENYLNKIFQYGQTIIAINDNKVIGCSLFYSNNIQTKIGYITLLCVDGIYRKKGIASYLLENTYFIMKKNGMTYCELSTNQNNNKSINLYTKQGFKILENKKGELHMRKELSELNILLTSVGRRGYLIEYFKKVLNGVGKVYASNSEYTSAFQYADEHIISPLIYDDNYVEFLINYCKKNNITMIISLFDIDLYVLASNKELFENEGIKVIVSDKDFIKICNDKWLTYEYLNSIGIATPRTYLSVEETIDAINSGNINYPLIVKPRWGMGSLEIFTADNEVELIVFYKKIKRNILKSYLKYEANQDFEKSVIIQEKIIGQEYGCDVINDLNGHYKNTIIRKKIAMRAGETDAAEIIKNKDILKLTQKLSKYTQHIANLDIDILEKDGQFYLLEMNARFGGGYPFSHAAGVNLPLAIVKWTENKNVNPEILEAKVGAMFQKDIRIMPLFMREENHE